MKDGCDAAILMPLAGYPAAAGRIVQHISGWDNYSQRKIAATIAGFLGSGAPPSLLDSLFVAEVARRRSARETFEVLTGHSVVEDIVFAATRWCRFADRREAGLGLLRTVVERSLAGEYWNTVSYAMAGLIFHRAPDAGQLLQHFVRFANGPPPADPGRPSLTQEREFAAELQRGNSAMIEESLSAREREAQNIVWDDEARRAIEEFMATARAVQRSSG